MKFPVHGGDPGIDPTCIHVFTTLIILFLQHLHFKIWGYFPLKCFHGTTRKSSPLVLSTVYTLQTQNNVTNSERLKY